MAYRYEGLRRTDFEQDLIALLRKNFELEQGPYRLRKSSLMYNEWVEAAGGRIKGTPAASSRSNSASPSRAATAVEEAQGEGEDEDLVVPLWLLKQSNDEQLARLFKLLHKLPACGKTPCPLAFLARPSLLF